MSLRILIVWAFALLPSATAFAKKEMPWDSAAAFLRVCSDEHQSRDREDTVDLAVRSIGGSGYLKGIIESRGLSPVQ